MAAVLISLPLCSLSLPVLLGKHFLCSLLPVVMEEAWSSMHPAAVSPAEGFSRLKCEARVIKLMR